MHSNGTLDPENMQKFQQQALWTSGVKKNSPDTELTLRTGIYQNLIQEDSYSLGRTRASIRTSSQECSYKTGVSKQGLFPPVGK